MQAISRQITHRNIGLFACAALILPALSLCLAWVSSSGQTVFGWGSFLAMLTICLILLLTVWCGLRQEQPPSWLFTAVLIAAILRLGAGAFWYTMLPGYGYGSPAEQAGYVMADASERDRSAWELGKSDKPLLRAFQGGYRNADQYGGLLFMSALIYRYFGAPVHQPLLMVAITAVFSSLGILFIWSLSKRLWSGRAALLAVWGLALYPEAVLLGSSQMREAFTITLVAAAFFGLVRFEQDHHWPGLAWMGISLVLSLAISPPVGLLLLVLLVAQALFMGKGLLSRPVFRKAWFRWLIFALVFLAVLGLWASWQRMAPGGAADPIEAVRFWLKKSSEFQAYLTERASGWVQKIFDSTPSWLHLPLLIIYGIVQPFLPAALADVTGAWIWRAIAVWRSSGWLFLLALLIYALLRAWRKNSDSSTRGLVTICWIVILLSAFRSGGDAWDNPRYRAMFAGLQIALAAWSWVDSRRSPDPWLKRVLICFGWVLAWFLPWYLRRYIYLPWPVTDVFKTLGLGLACAVLYLVSDIVRRKSP